MKQNYSFLQRVSAIAASFINPFKKSLRLLPFLCLLAFSANAWGAEITLFDLNFASLTNETISTTNSSATFISKTYSGYGVAFGVKRDKPISIVNGAGLSFDNNNYNSYTCLAIPLNVTKGEVVTVTVKLASAGKIKYAFVEGALPSNPNAGSGVTFGSSAINNILTYTPTSNQIVLYLGRSGSNSGKVVESVKIVQQSTSSSYSITYNTNGGTAIEQTTNVTALPNLLPECKRTGYRFDGWYTDEVLTNPAIPGTPISADITLYAQWTPVEYNITYEGVEGATNNNPITYTIETPTIIFAPLSKDGYIFKGWDPARIEQGSTGDKTITASWEAISTAGYCISVYNTKNANDSKKHYFVQKEEGKSEYIITNFTVPEFNGTPNYWVGKNDNWVNDYSVNANFAEMPLTTKPESLRLGAATGAVGTLHIWDDNKALGSNLWIKFTPDGYGLAWGTGSWNEDDYLPFTSTDGVTYTTDMVTLTQEQLDNWEYYVGYKTAGKAVAFSSANSNTIRVNTMGVYDAAKTEWWNGNIGGFFTAGQHGRFRMWADNTGKNFNCHFMPYYTIVYKANYPEGITGAPDDTYGEYVGLEEEKTLKLAAAPVAPAGYIFKGWTTAQDGTGDLLSPDDNYDLNNPSSNTTLYAQWEEQTPLPVGGCQSYWLNVADVEQVGTAQPYKYEVANVGCFMRNKTGSSTLDFNDGMCNCDVEGLNKSFTTGSKIFAFQTYNKISGFTVYGAGTGNNRTFTKLEVGTATDNYKEITVTTDDKFDVSGACDSMHIDVEIDANSYIALTFSGNVNVYAIRFEYCPTLPECVAPTISKEPVSVSYCANVGIEAMSVEASVTDGGTLTYQWQKDDTPIEGATNAIYQPTEAGVYTCVVTNTKNGYSPTSVISASAMITIKSLPKITKQPQSVEWFIDNEVTFTVDASDAESFQWYTYNADGGVVAISGATEATYTFTPTETGTTTYYVEAVNSCGSFKSEEVTLIATVEPSCGLLIKATLTADNQANVDGIYAGTAEVHVANTVVDGGYKLGSDDTYIALTLKEGKLFAEGDEVIVEVTKTSPMLQIFADKGTTLLVETSSVVVGENRLLLPASAIGLPKIYLYRTSSAMNPYVKSMSVERPCCTRPKLAYGVSAVDYALNSSDALPQLTNPYAVTVSSYSSSNPDVATVDAATGEVTIIGLGTTTISAIFDGDETYCAATASYQLNVICGDDVPQIAPSVSDIGCEAIELRLLQSDGTTPVSSGNVQWYCDGVAIDGATGYTYTATTAGEYTATLEQNCPVSTSNKAVLTSIINAPIAKAVAPFRTHQIANRKVGDVAVRPYSETTHYPLFTLQPTGTAAQDKEYAFSYIVRNGLDNIKSVTSELLTDTDLKWIREDARDEDGTIHIGANYLELGEWIKSYNESHTDNPFVVGDTIWLTVHPANACSEFDDAVTATIPIKLTDKFSIAYIITGTVDGGFYDVNKGDLGAFYEEFRKSYYEITPVNAYAPYDYSNYEPYDLVILTDYPKATGTKSQPNKVNALADLVDRKPILSFKAHMAADGLDKWKEIGFLASPEVPDEVQKSIQLLCSNHPIFSEDNVGQVEILSQGDSKKGLQGFSELGMDGFVNIATIDGGTKGTLVACCERQKVVEARLVVLSIYSGATQNITEKGMQAVDNVLKYLLQTDETTLSDCSVIFNGEQDNQWTTAGNWEGGAVPTRLQNVRIEADCEVSGGELQVISNVNIKNGCHLTIKPDGALGSLGKFSVYSDENKTYSDITDPKYITIKAEQTGTGALLHTHHLRPLVATVELYSKAYVEMVDGKKQPHWSYIGIPVQEAPIPQFFRGAYTWGYDETNQNIWTRFNDGTTMQAFQGYGLSQSAPQLFTLTGQLVKAEDKIIELTKTAGAGEGQNLIGNSWTAPIQITLLEESDFGEGLNQTIYIYNTGRDGADGVAGGDADNNTPGQWRTIPIALAKQDGYTGPKTIPAMQAFEVDFLPDATQTTANLTLEYNRVVRTSKGTDLNMPLYAPRPKAQAPADEPELMRICVEDSRTRTELYLLQDERFTNEYDNGWDGFYKEGDGRSAGLWTYTPIGDMAVSAQPAIDGTTLGFVPGRENVYTFSFKWTGQTLYLNDMLLQRATLIQTGNTYTFTAFEGEQKNRFVISSVPCQEVITSLEQLVLTGDLLTLNNPTGETFDVMVYDPAGRLCIRQQTADNMVQLNLPQNQGVYMVCVGSTNGNKVYKVVR